MQSMQSESPYEVDARPEFWQLSMRCCILAGSVDVAFFFIFHVLDSPVLAWINVISVAMYVSAYRVFAKRRNRLGFLLIQAEVLIHAGVGTLLIGWESGFHYYLLMFIPALFVSTSSRIAWVLAGHLWVYYVGLHVLMWYVQPLQPISSAALLSVNIFNLTVVFCMFSYLALFYVATVKLAHMKLSRMATTDSLTGLLNRRQLIVLAEKLIARQHRHPSDLTLMLLDIDHFKKINDDYGHNVGDRVLIAVSQYLQSAMREQDFIGRWGGEEFLAVLPETDFHQAAESAERLRKGVQSLDIQSGVNKISVTLSIGITQYLGDEALSNAIVRADCALYKGKSSGRNRVEAVQA